MACPPRTRGDVGKRPAQRGNISNVLPGHLATSVVRVRGFDVDFIGPSVPADDLVGFLDPAPPPAVIVSCTTQMSLVGAWRTISALRSLGTRVIAGGRGFGPAGSWAVAVGADDFADSFASGADLLVACDSLPAPRAREPAGDPAAIAEAESIHTYGETAVEAAIQSAARRWPAIRSTPAAYRATREDISATLKTLTSALVAGTDDVLAEFIGWFEDVLASRGLPIGYVPTALELVADFLPDSFPLAHAVAVRGIGLCRSAPMKASDPVI